jgi:LysM repeat protein
MKQRHWLTAVLLTVVMGVWLALAVFANTTYTVVRGDTLSSIARRFNVTTQALVEANNIVNPNLIYVGQVLTIPDGSTPPPAPTPPPATPDQNYTVRAGDTLTRIAVRFGVTVSQIMAANNLTNPNFIYVGQVLVIPGSGSTPPPPAATPTTGPPPAPTQVPPTPTPPASGYHSYTVQAGDTLTRIAARFGVTVNQIMAANNLTNPNFIYVGQVLRIPAAGSVPSTPVPPQPTATAPAPQPTAPAPQPTAPAPPPPPPAGFALGGQTHTLANPGLMRDIGMTWVKFQHKWGEGDRPDVLSARISAARAQGMRVLFSIPGADTYPSSINFAAYVDFMAGVAALADPPDALEIWNEMNIDFEWPAGTISPQQYVDQMLRPAYQRIKAANPNILVISGAPAPTGFDNGHNAWADDRYMIGMAAAGGANYMDCIGVHHNAGATSPAASTGHPGGSHYSWYFFPTLNMYYNAFSGARPVCITELGYVTGEDFGGTLPPAFSWANGTTLAQHAQWLGQAVTLSAQSGKVQMLVLFNVDITHYDPNADPQAGYALIRPNGSCPACDPIRSAMGR